jgi:hypothetical protein
MDAGMALRPVVNVAGVHAQPAVPVSPAAPTALPANKAVPPLVKDEPARNEPRRVTKSNDKTTHDAIIDPATSTVVYRVLDANTRQVLHQVPDQAALRMQAYARTKAACALASGKNPHDAVADSVSFSVDTLT